jgi:putative Mg2+ transporter-C (MgtC) family protein
MITMIPYYEMLLRLAIAGVLGSLVGLERERAESAAGLRTHALVALGSALLVLVSMFGFNNALRPPAVVLDPSRVAAQIVTGIGFLGAGVIIFRKSIIRGLTTAASVWLVAAIGMAVGGGLYIPAVGGTILGLAILAIMKPLEVRLFARRRLQTIRLVIDRRALSANNLRALMTKVGGSIVSRVDVRYQRESQKMRADVILQTGNAELIARICDQLADHDGVLEVRATFTEAGVGPADK